MSDHSHHASSTAWWRRILLILVAGGSTTVLLSLAQDLSTVISTIVLAATCLVAILWTPVRGKTGVHTHPATEHFDSKTANVSPAGPVTGTGLPQTSPQDHWLGAASQHHRPQSSVPFHQTPTNRAAVATPDSPSDPAPVPLVQFEQRPSRQGMENGDWPHTDKSLQVLVEYVETRLEGSHVTKPDTWMDPYIKRVEEALSVYTAGHSDTRAEQWLAALGNSIRSPLNELGRYVNELIELNETPECMNTLYDADRRVRILRRVTLNLGLLSLEPSRLQVSRNPWWLHHVLHRAAGDIREYNVPQFRQLGQYKLRPDCVEAVKHIAAELLNNATVQSATVWVYTQEWPEGVSIEICDGGLKMDDENMRYLNRLLSQCPLEDVVYQRRANQFGLAAVALLAKSYDITVRLEPSVVRGVQAKVFLPFDLFVNAAQPSPEPSPDPVPKHHVVKPASGDNDDSTTKSGLPRRGSRNRPSPVPDRQPSQQLDIAPSSDPASNDSLDTVWDFMAAADATSPASPPNSFLQTPEGY